MKSNGSHLLILVKSMKTALKNFNP